MQTSSLRCAIKTPRLFALVSLLILSTAAAVSQKPATVSTSPVPVVMVSDIHFDPFRDPAKVDDLNATPVSGWAAIFAKPNSPTQATDFEALGKSCKERGLDTDSQLLEASLAGMVKQQPKPLFVTVSGDLTAHGFLCRYTALSPKIKAPNYSAFAAKVVAFVALRLHQTYPGVPVYLALGNNDSGCDDYAETINSDYLKATGKTFAEDVLSPSSSKAILAEFSALGDYNIALPAPIQHGRLIVLQDLFESKKYKPCNATAPQPIPPAVDQQIAWLNKQLAAAAAAHEQVWVMAHIPPGIDVYSTFSKARDVCGGKSPEMFLNSDGLATAIASHASTVRLAIFAHSHMDEMRLLAPLSGPGVPTKLVPSISPVNGNNPAFTVAQVDPKTATMVDYSVYAASNKTGINTTFSEEYRYGTAYNEPDFGPSSVADLTAKFVADKNGATAASKAYQNNFFVGDPGISANAKAAAMRIVWPAYACSIQQSSEQGYRSCVCPATPTQPPATN